MEDSSSVLSRSWNRRETSKISGSHICCMLFWVTISSAMIVIGSLYIDKCPVEPKIPLYLIVAGAVYLAGFILLPLKMVSVKLIFCLEFIFCLFSFCWFTAGSIWVFGIYQDDHRDCEDLVYQFTFGVLILEYIFLVFISIIVCLCSSCISYLTAKIAMDSKPPESACLVSAEN
ncbi:transmembrane protein 272-like [Mantella aurantiaca]